MGRRDIGGHLLPILRAGVEVGAHGRPHHCGADLEPKACEFPCN